MATTVEQLQAAANYLLLAQAEESPLHVDFAQRIANAAVTSGFTTSQGRMEESLKLKPFSTFALFAAFLAGSGQTLPVP